jgi:hypothetical protein
MASKKKQTTMENTQVKNRKKEDETRIISHGTFERDTDARYVPVRRPCHSLMVVPRVH